MKRWLLMCTNKQCQNGRAPYAVYAAAEPLCCYYCGRPVDVRGGFSKVKGIPVREVLARGIYKAPIV